MHAPIAEYFQTGMGIELQSVDADIAERVMLTMMDENVLALPVHDSFIVWDTKLDRLREVMLDAYHHYMRSEIGVKADPVWIEEHLSAEAHELHEAGVRHIEDSLYEYREAPKYARYRNRLWDWLAMKKGKAGATRIHSHCDGGNSGRGREYTLSYKVFLVGGEGSPLWFTFTDPSPSSSPALTSRLTRCHRVCLPAAGSIYHSTTNRVPSPSQRVALNLSLSHKIGSIELSRLLGSYFVSTASSVLSR